MRPSFSLFCCLALLASCTTQKFFIVRHAEKATAVMSGNPPLSAEGEAQAQDLAALLQGEKVDRIYSTDFVRTKATAAPVAATRGLQIILYTAGQEAALVKQLGVLRGQRILVVGHSNTVDDLVNGLTNKNLMSDLPDSTYKMLYLVKKRGKRVSFTPQRIPEITPRN